ncbi:hypothetical protein B0H17DRAFT_1141625 [Mycena rosella]|uniref:Uncharacterized protein n=1 Tax=Mycena rosella TaxID=1033263 RepID=A0AAD7D0H6_MYCRO|nr:hypothetical protein B0H17DRAFT_1141625 [Mycena rosella]
MSPAPALKQVSANTFFSWFCASYRTDLDGELFFNSTKILRDVWVLAGAFLGHSLGITALMIDWLRFTGRFFAQYLTLPWSGHAPSRGAGLGFGRFDDPDSPGPSKKRKVESGSKTRKTKAKGKGKAKAVAEPVDQGLRITLSGKNGAPGMFVDEVIDITEAPECSASSCRVHFGCFGNAGVSTTWATESRDRGPICECQDAWDGGTESKKSGLAKATILNEGARPLIILLALNDGTT